MKVYIKYSNLIRSILHKLGIIICLTLSPVVWAQQSKVTGVVFDENNEPLMGVTVTVKGANTTYGTATDVDGAFTLNASPKDVLHFSYIGYASKSVALNGKTNLKIVLQPENSVLDEVVVVGYGQVKKKDVLGSISSVKADELKDRASGNVIESLRGMTSGIKITNSGQAGSNATMRIRGLGSLTDNNPLFIIDGAYAGGDLGVNVEDIESVQVLKDASSAAIYGSRAANGVVIITTKKGNTGDLKVNFSSQVSVNWVPRYDLMDAETYKIFDDRAYDEAILAGVDGVTKRQNHYDSNTDWQDEMLKTGTIQNYTLSFSGGSKALGYYTSFNRYVNDGTMNYTGYDRYGFRVNTNGTKGIFSYGENLYYTKSKTKVLNGIGNVWSNFITMPPTIPVYDEEHLSGFGYGDTDRANSYGLNPVAMQELENTKKNEEYLNGNIFGQINLLDMLEAKLNFAYKSYFSQTDKLRKTGGWTMGQGTDASYLSYSSTRSHDYLIEHTYRFYHDFGKHNIEALLGGSYNKYHVEYRGATRLYPLELDGSYITSINSATGTSSSSGSYGEYSIISYFGRINYSYDDRYLVQITGRRDGTSRLPKKRRWGNFMSYSLGWRISQEQFFDVDWIDDLKIRANYGTLGNSNIGNWDYVADINTAPRAIIGGSDDKVIGMTQSQLVNSNLKWEEKTTINIGLDFSTLGSRLRLSADYFKSKSKDLLVQLPILMSTGNEGSAPMVNAGSLSNQGVEFEIGWNDKIGRDFTYSASVNISRVKNKVLDLGYGNSTYTTSLAKSVIGQPLGMWYMYRMLGIFQSQEQIDSYTNAQGKKIQPNALPGDIIYDDYDGDGSISSNDRQIVGSPWPKLELGVNLTASYKGFDLAINGYGRFGHLVYNGAAATAGDFANNQNNFNGIVPWTQENPVNDRPRIVYGDSRNSRSDQNRWLEDGSFFRISDISLGYTVPKSLTKKVKIEDVRASVTLQNMITFTKYTGLDPEFSDSGIWTIGYDGCSYPNPRSVQFALQFSF
jgi:TonB-linked SusC/RagA family outer membrane protein